MSQPCSLPSVVLFDARALAQLDVQQAVRTVASRGIQRGAIVNDPDVVRIVNDAGCEDALDFWLGDEPGIWPFERALAVVNADPERVLFVSTDPEARSTAQAHGLRVYDRPMSDIDHVLP